jgi:DNA-binding NarL/FixJ family response regulator
MKAITVLLADDHTIVRQGLCALLKAEADIAVIGEAENGREAVALTTKLQPQVVVIDISMPILNGMEATRQILQTHPATKVIILSGHSEDAYVERIIALGAAGYLIKQSAANILSTAIREVRNGNLVLSPSIAMRRKDNASKAHIRGEKPGAALTAREAEVIQLIAEGKANKETADILGISIKTVEKHRQRVMEKLNLHDTASLTRHAIAAGMVEIAVMAE